MTTQITVLVLYLLIALLTISYTIFLSSKEAVIDWIFDLFEDRLIKAYSQRLKDDPRIPCHLSLPNVDMVIHPRKAEIIRLRSNHTLNRMGSMSRHYLERIRGQLIMELVESEDFQKCIIWTELDRSQDRLIEAEIKLVQPRRNEN